MKKLLAVLILLAATAAIAQNQMTVTSTTIASLSGSLLATGQACFLATDNAGTPISLRFANGGQAMRRSVCTSVTNGVLSQVLPNVALTNPANACIKLTVKDSSNGQMVIDKGYECLQPTSSAYWCAGSTCNLDNFIPNNAPGVVQTPGLQGPPGLPCDPSITGSCTLDTPIVAPEFCITSGGGTAQCTTVFPQSSGTCPPLSVCYLSSFNQTTGVFGVGTLPAFAQAKTEVTGSYISSYNATTGVFGTTPLPALPAQPYIAGITYNGKPSNGLIIVRSPTTLDTFTVPANCTHSVIFGETGAAADATFTLQKCTFSANTVSCSTFGTAVISAGNKYAAFTCATATTFTHTSNSVFDFLKVIAPATADGTLADLGGGIWATR